MHSEPVTVTFAFLGGWMRHRYSYLPGAAAPGRYAAAPRGVIDSAACKGSMCAYLDATAPWNTRDRENATLTYVT